MSSPKSHNVIWAKTTLLTVTLSVCLRPELAKIITKLVSIVIMCFER